MRQHRPLITNSSSVQRQRIIQPASDAPQRRLTLHYIYPSRLHSLSGNSLQPDHPVNENPLLQHEALCKHLARTGRKTPNVLWDKLVRVFFKQTVVDAHFAQDVRNLRFNILSERTIRFGRPRLIQLVAEDVVRIALRGDNGSSLSLRSCYPLCQLFGNVIVSKRLELVHVEIATPLLKASRLIRTFTRLRSQPAP